MLARCLSKDCTREKHQVLCLEFSVSVEVESRLQASGACVDCGHQLRQVAAMDR
jgi:hypothetical protein